MIERGVVERHLCRWYQHATPLPDPVAGTVARWVADIDPGMTALAALADTGQINRMACLSELRRAETQHLCSAKRLRLPDTSAAYAQWALTAYVAAHTDRDPVAGWSIDTLQPVKGLTPP